MKSFQRSAAVVAVLMILAGVHGLHAQVVGGWSKVSVKNKEVVAAARFAAKEWAMQEIVKFKKIISARQQVVAGMNYELTLLMKHEKRTQKAVAVVWKKTDGTYQLVSWKWDGE